MGFQQGLSGLSASSKSLDTIGNNIANSGTVGFKAGSAQFADVFAASLSGAGTAPVGIGSKVAAIVQQFSQGNISTTSNPLDTAINGGGFFQIDDGSGATIYGRNGQFQLDKDGYIVNSQGLKLKGVMAVDGVIVTGAPPTPLRLFDSARSLAGAPQPTGLSAAGTGVLANVNLDSRDAVPSVTPFNYANPATYNQSSALNVYDSLGNSHTYSMYFVKTSTANTWDVYATLTNPEGAVPAFMDLSAGPAAVSAASAAAIAASLLPGATPASIAAAAKAASDAVAVPTTVGQMVFNSSGVLTSAALAQSLTDEAMGFTGAVDTPQAFPVDFSGSTQYGSAFAVNSLSQDGFASGSLSGFNIGADGVILGRYSNGQSKAIGQIVLANFRNPQGLQPLGDNRWGQTSASGEPLSGTPGSTGQYGVLQSSAVEDSNVDLTAELVSMITQQRAYQANAQTIKTVDQILQTLVNLR